MALISQVVYATDDNGKAELHAESLKSLYEKVNWQHHRFVLVCNGSTPKARLLSEFWVRKINEKFPGKAERILCDKNHGTARAINKAWKRRLPGEHVIKIDDDMTVCQPDWPDLLEEAARRLKRGFLARAPGHPSPPGLVALKRKDLGESPYRTDWGASKYAEVDHVPGERWLVYETCAHVMGSCCLHTSDLLDKVGYLDQGGHLYGYDDSLMSDRAQAAGFSTGFLVGGIEVDHIDPGGTPFQAWKERYSGVNGPWRKLMRLKYLSGEISYYHGPEDE